MNSSDSAPRVWITSEDIQNYRKSHPVSWGPLGERVYDRTYSRPTDNGKEDWHETCARVVNGNCNFVSPEFIEPNEPRKLYEALLTHQIVPGGRHLWATGVQTGNSAINNCHGADFTTRFSEHFEHMFMRLMEGGGVGSNVSDKFIQSKAKGKWTITTPHELHIVCADYHQDIDTTLELDNHEDAKLLGFMTEEGTLQNGAVFPNKDSDYFVKVPFRSLLSKEMSYSSAPISGDDRVYISVGDSREGWAEALVKILDIYVSEGPKKKIVVDITGIRPHGAPIRTFGGTASGPGALMLLLSRITSLFNSQLGVVTWKQVALIEHWIALAVISGGTRRSARMLMKYWQDPGIFEFIKLKEHHASGHMPHHTTNISVVVDKKFFRAIRRQDSHAMAVLDAIVLNMLMNGEPGLVNASNQLIDEIKGAVFYTTNPSLRGNTKVLTSQGVFNIKDLAENNPNPFVMSIDGDWVPAWFRQTGTDQQLYCIKYKNGSSVYATKEHTWPVKTGDSWVKKETRLLEKGDKIFQPTIVRAVDNESCTLTKEDGFALGWLYGDGWLTWHKTQKTWQLNMVFGKQDMDAGIGDILLDYCKKIDPTLTCSLRQDHESNCWVLCTTNKAVVQFFMEVLKANPDKSQGLPESVWQGSHEFVHGFLSGLFSADGHIGHEASYPSQTKIQLTSSREKLIDDVRDLLSLYGVLATKRKLTTSLNGKQYTSYVLVVRPSSLLAHKDAGFPILDMAPSTKQDRLNAIYSSYTEGKSAKLGAPYKTYDGLLEVESVTPSDIYEDVYDGTVEHTTHTYVTANGVTGNCGEITMVKYDDMDCFDVCCIGHLNLATLEDPDGKARLLARFLMRASMSRVIDPRMKMNVDRNHRLGAGILGYADWLLLNGVRYSEAPKNGEVKKFFSHLRDRITEEANNYAHTLRVVAPIKTTTIAPTGTIANLSGVTSGMQPVFAQYYIRRVRYADTGDQQTLDNLRSQGYNVYQDPYSPATSVVDFVTEHVLHGRAMELFKQKHPELPESEIRDMVDDLFEDEGTLTFTDVFANQEMLQECWANNSISVTANVRRETDTEELRQQISEVTKAILFYGERLKGLTMFPEVSMEAAPLERLTKEEFNKYREQGYPIDVSQDEQKCVNGVCPIK